MKTYAPESKSSWKSSTTHSQTSAASESSHRSQSQPGATASYGPTKRTAPVAKPWGATIGNVASTLAGRTANSGQIGAIQRKPESSLRPNSLAGDTPHSSSHARESTSAKADGRSANRTGLPNRLKAGIERLSGMSMDDVRVRYNSPKPARLGALAYTQGTQIHVGPKQEKYLAHEAWHVVQQKQGRVKPTIQFQGKAINADKTLEAEADVMGAKALRLAQAEPSTVQPISRTLQGRYQNLVGNVMQMQYPNLKVGGDSADITEEEFASARFRVTFTGINSCIGLVGRINDTLTGVHMVLVGSGDKSLADGGGDNNLIDNTAATVAATLAGSAEVKVVGQVRAWRGIGVPNGNGATRFLAKLATHLPGIISYDPDGQGNIQVQYSNLVGWY